MSHLPSHRYTEAVDEYTEPHRTDTPTPEDDWAPENPRW
jgi:hypothetical protein